jgi:hypothetical protein
MKNYGEYGIGLKKEWGIRNNLSVVNYTNKESAKASGMRLITTIYSKIIQSNLDHNDLAVFQNAYSLLLMLTKPYEGFKIDKNGRHNRNNIYRFYDEREWRYIPLVDKLRWSLSLKDFNNDITKLLKEVKVEQSRYHEESSLQLSFEIADIDYIFLKEENEVSKLESDLSRHYSDEEINLILSKVIFSSSVLARMK